MTERVTDPQKLLSGAVADQALTAAGNTGTRSASFPSAADLATVTLALKAAPAPVLYYHADQLGSTRVLTDSKASVVATYTYDAYGRQTAHTGTVDTPLQYAGQYRDPETGFYYLRARYYDPSTASFLTRDPAFAATLSAYGYVDGNPLNGSDPSGLCGHWYDVACQASSAASWVGDNAGTIAVGAGAVAVGALLVLSAPVSLPTAVVFGVAFVGSVAAGVGLAASLVEVGTTCYDSPGGTECATAVAGALVTGVGGEAVGRLCESVAPEAGFYGSEAAEALVRGVQSVTGHRSDPSNSRTLAPHAGDIGALSR